MVGDIVEHMCLKVLRVRKIVPLLPSFKPKSPTLTSNAQPRHYAWQNLITGKKIVCV